MDGSAAVLVVAALVPLTYIALWVLERRYPARELPIVEGWVKKGIVFYFITGAIEIGVPAMVAFGFQEVRPFPAPALGLASSVALVVVGTEAIAYAIHRMMHRSPWLWRWTHQMHHSAERVDVPGSLYFHPFDAALQSALTAVPAALLGVTPTVASIAAFVFFSLAIFQHANLKTPRWLGWFVMRPEQHAQHHERGVHDHNYGNFAFMDVVFGTYRNPDRFVAETGFYDGASARVSEMLRGEDVNSSAA